MYEKLRKLNFQKEKVILAVVAFIAVILTLWISNKPAPEGAKNEDWTLSVPKGFLVVPLVLSNGQTLARMMDQRAIVDVFSAHSSTPMAENLRVIKLSNDEPPSFGALVPESNAGRFQQVFSGPGLKAAIRTSASGATKFHLAASRKQLLREISTGD